MSAHDFSECDVRMMLRALELADRALYSADPNPRVGCVLAHGESIVGEGYTDPVGGPHAEVNALRVAGARARGATAYVTLEPCSHHGRTPPCADALAQAGVLRVVYAVGDPNPLVNGGGHERLRAAGIETVSGVLADAAREVNVGFFSRMERGRPWVIVKIGASLDGKIALANGKSQWITGEASRQDVQRQRARSSAIMTGVGTALADDPRLTVRDVGIDTQGRKPLRVICDSTLRTPASARLFKEAGPILVATVGADEARTADLNAAGAEVIEVAPDESGRVSLSALLQVLGQRGCNELLVEAGPTLSGQMLAQQLADELLVYQAPIVLGSAAQSMLRLPEVVDLQDRWQFRLFDCARIDGDLRLRYRRA